MTTQTIGTGGGLVKKYANHGHFGHRGRMLAPFAKLFGMILGMPNSGKTTFFMSHPGALILNFDYSSVPYPEEPPAQFWPGIGPDGRPVDLNGSVIELKWSHVEALVTDLVNAAAQNLPRPETIVLDSLGAMIHVLQEDLVSREGAESWRKLPMHGMTAWDTVYTKLTQTAAILKAAGYGVFFISHVNDKFIPIDDNIFTQRIELSMTDTLWNRLHSRLEFVGWIEAEEVEESITDPNAPKEMELPGGKKVKLPEKRITQKRFVRRMRTQDSRLSRILKRRVSLPPSVELPLTGGWETFEKQYNALI